MLDDPMLSQVNSHVTFRQSFVLGDMVSMSGTDLNGEPVEEQFRALGNYAKIRTGSTHWLFVVIDPALASRWTNPGTDVLSGSDTGSGRVRHSWPHRDRWRNRTGEWRPPRR